MIYNLYLENGNVLGFKHESQAIKAQSKLGGEIKKQKPPKQAIKRGLGGYQGQRYSGVSGRVSRR